MLCVANKPIMLSVIMLNVIVIMLNVIMLNVIMPNVIMLNVIMLNVIMLNAIILSVVAPLKQMCSSIVLRPLAQSLNYLFSKFLRQKIQQQKDISAAIFWQKLANAATFRFIKKAVIRI
jgi:hypothetical protein